MKTKLDKLIEQIDPSRTLNEVSSRVDEAVNRFTCSIGSINDYNRFEQVLSQFVRHVDNQVLHMPSDFAPSSYDWAKCVRILEKEYGDQGHKVAFEMASTGIAGGLYEVLKRVAYHLAYDFAQNEISARVIFFGMICPWTKNLLQLTNTPINSVNFYRNPTLRAARYS